MMIPEYSPVYGTVFKECEHPPMPTTQVRTWAATDGHTVTTFHIQMDVPRPRPRVYAFLWRALKPLAALPREVPAPGGGT